MNTFAEFQIHSFDEGGILLERMRALGWAVMLAVPEIKSATKGSKVHITMTARAGYQHLGQWKTQADWNVAILAEYEKMKAESPQNPPLPKR